MHGEGAVVAGDPAAAEEQVGGHVEEGVRGPLVGVDGFALRHVDALLVRFGAPPQFGGLRGGLFGSGALWCRVCGGVFGRGGHGVPFGLGRPVRSTLTLLILVPRFSPTPRHATRPKTRAGCPRAPPLPLSPAQAARRPSSPSTPKGAASATDAAPFGVNSRSVREQLGGVMGGLARKGCSVCIREALRLALRGGEPRVAGCSAVV